MAGDTGMAGKVALFLWAQGDRDVTVLKTSMLHQCSIGDSLGIHTSPHPSRCCCPCRATPTQPCPFSLPAQTLGLAGAQTTQLLVEPPWTPAVLWDRVTLTCQGWGTAGDTTWYKDGQRLGQKHHDHFLVNESGTYTCDRPDWLVLQVPARALLEEDTVTLRCRSWQDRSLIKVHFYLEEKHLGGVRDRTQISLSPLQLHHSGRYRCRGWVGAVTPQWRESKPVTVTVHMAVGTGPLSFTWHRRGSRALLATGPRLELRHVEDKDSGDYHCRVSNGDSVAKSVPVNITVLVPVANATITPGPLSHQVRAGDPVTLRCSVQVGSAPVTFTWLHNGQEVAWDPVLELVDVSVGHSGTYQCVATNQLGQDGHRVFRALSPELVLEVTSASSWVTAMAVNVGRTLLFLVLLLSVIGGCHCWHRLACRKLQDRSPQLVSLSGPPTGVPWPCPTSGSTSDQRGAAGTLQGTAGPP